ncbi:MAG: hypothetical protein Q8P41_16830 [Pseudomonadota bacterium]|nr:hypothetical protein [Pseudomonadota bacterium]
MSASSPRFVVLGGPVPERLRADLSGEVDLLEGADLVDPATDGVLVHAHAELFPALRRFRDGGGRLPIFGLAEGPVDVDQRIRWIREGADDLLDLETAAATLSRKLRAEVWRPAGRPTPPTENLPVAARVDRWLTAAGRYLPARELLVETLGLGGRNRYLDCAFLRDQLVRAGDTDVTADVFGQRRGSEREPLGWPVQLLAPIEGGGELLNIGADGACISLPSAPGPGERLHVRIEGTNVAATMELEVRWRRRVSRDRWQVGAFGIACSVARDV